MAAQLKATNLHKHFGSLEVLKGITLEAKKGDVIALIGSSGSGKSTLLRCLNLLEVPSQGEIEVCGTGWSASQALGRGAQHDTLAIRRKLGFVFQSFNLWSHMSIMENLIEGPISVLGQPRRDAIAKGQALLESVGLPEIAQRFPIQLSGGQQQRVAIARALAMEPQVLLFDEPTSALDPELVSEVLNVIRDLAAEGRTMLIVTHEMGFARDVANRVVFLHDGQILEDGPPDQIMTAPKTDRLRDFLSAGRA